METLQIKDKKFAVSIPESEILKQVKRVAGEINRDLAGTEPVFLAILNGSFIFAADLMREIRLAAQISFVKLASYVGTSSTGSVCEMIGLNADIAGRDVVVVEDIVDLDIPYKCFSIPNDFILGYGLDYDGYGRNTRDIYTVVE